MGRPDHDYVWLVTDNEYSDFVLRLRFQAYRDSPGNSGVQIRSRYDDQAGWLDGPQVDIHPPGPWRTGMIWDETRGSGPLAVPAGAQRQVGEPVDGQPGPRRSTMRTRSPPGTLLEIRAVGTAIDVVLNGIPVTSYDGATVLDDEVHRERAVGLRGHIALQIHTGDQLKIRFRDIAVREPTP